MRRNKKKIMVDEKWDEIKKIIKWIYLPKGWEKCLFFLQ
jgi:hypothetical protein